MALFLKQSTQCTIMFGPFVDKTDGVTLKTDATTITDIDHATTGIFLSKNGGTAAIRHQGIAAASVADAYGMMKVTLDTTDTNTVGNIDVLFAKAATYLPVHKSFVVLEETTFDALITNAAGAAGGLVLNGAANAGTTTFAALTCTGALTTGSIANGGTTTLTGAVSTGAVTKAAETVTAAWTVGSIANGGTTTLTGAVGTGALTVASQTVTGALTTGSIVNNGTTTLTGAVGTGALTVASQTVTGALTTGSIVDNGVLTVSGVVTGLATPTNITAGTIATVTTLTNPVTLANGAHGGAAATLTLSGAAGLIATKIDAPINGAITGNITGNLSGSVGTVTLISANGIAANSFAAGAIDATAIKDAAIDFATFAADCKTGTGLKANVESITDNAITAAAIANAAIDNATFAADVGTTAIATNVIGIAAKKGIVDAVNVDTYAEPGQEAPASTNTLVKKVGYLFKAWRNQAWQTATDYTLYNAAGAVVDQKSTVSDDATTFKKTVVVSGP